MIGFGEFLSELTFVLALFGVFYLFNEMTKINKKEIKRREELTKELKLIRQKSKK